jgi:hypothetical protein
MIKDYFKADAAGKRLAKKRSGFANPSSTAWCTPGMGVRLWGEWNDRAVIGGLNI